MDDVTRFRVILVAWLVIVAGLAVAARADAASLASRYTPNELGEITDPQIVDAASAIVGRPVDVTCVPFDPDVNLGWTWGNTDENGVEYVPDWFALRGDVCGDLDKLINWRDNAAWLRKDDHAWNAGWAILYLVHESMHVALQSTDEGVTECTAYRNLWPSVARLELPPRLRARVLDGAKAAHEMIDGEDPELAPYTTVC